MNSPSPTRAATGYYPWVVALTGMLALFLSNGMTATGITIFDPSLLDEFHWSRGDFKFRDFLNFLVTALIAPFVGILIDRFNPKYLLMFGCTLLTLGYFGYSMIANGGLTGSGIVWVGLVVVGVLLGIGLSWALLRAKATGQVEVN